jgi:hypothetical protein
MIHLGFVFCCVYCNEEHDSPCFCVLLYTLIRGTCFTWVCVLLGALLRGTWFTLVLCSVVYITTQNRHDSPGFCVLLCILLRGTWFTWVLCSAGCITTWNMIHLGFVFFWEHYYVEHDSPWFCVLLCSIQRGTWFAEWALCTVVYGYLIRGTWFLWICVLLCTWFAWVLCTDGYITTWNMILLSFPTWNMCVLLIHILLRGTWFQFVASAEYDEINTQCGGTRRDCVLLKSPQIEFGKNLKWLHQGFSCC